ncbi:MAG TPA: arginase family protein [Candidatus Limnocylindria bacterium]|nr:arginase family protein [Candidatus Limnocylindria bacterium]
MTRQTFLGIPAVTLDSLEAGYGAVVLGIPHGVPYPDPGPTAGCADAPGAVRARSQRVARFVGHHDFDLDAPLAIRAVDAGDVQGAAGAGAANSARAEAAVRAVLDAGAVPVVLGGDDSIPIPVLRAFAGRPPLTVVQVDAHLDFRDEVAGVRDGYSSPMRRAAEMPHVERIVQVGLRGVGSARSSDVADARAAGNLLVTARELGERGVPWLLGHVPEEASVFLSFDLDGLDPSVAPAVSALSPGGLTWAHATDLVLGLAGRPGFAGAAFTELVPALDVDGRSSLAVARLVTLLLAGMARRAPGDS